MKNRIAAAAGLLTAGVVLLSGCAAGSGIPALDRPAADEDRWPGDPQLLADSGMSLDSSRLLATVDGADYFVAASDDQQTACLFKFEHDSPGEGPVGGCGGLGAADFIVEFSVPDAHAALVRSDAEIRNYESQGWQQIHENIFTKDS